MDKSKRFVWITNQSTILPISKPPSHFQGTPKKLLVKLTGSKRLQISPLPLHRNTTELPAVECLERKKCVWVMWVEHDCACPRSLGAQLQAATHRRDDELGRPALSQDRRRASCQQQAQRLHHQPRCHGGETTLIAPHHEGFVSPFTITGRHSASHHSL